VGRAEGGWWLYIEREKVGRRNEFWSRLLHALSLGGLGIKRGDIYEVGGMGVDCRISIYLARDGALTHVINIYTSPTALSVNAQSR
jgi:hypothetical protein